MGMADRLSAMDEREKIGGGAVMLAAGILILALLTFAGIQGRSLRLVLGIMGVMTVVIGVLSIGISEKAV